MPNREIKYSRIVAVGCHYNYYQPYVGEGLSSRPFRGQDGVPFPSLLSWMKPGMVVDRTVQAGRSKIDSALVPEANTFTLTTAPSKVVSLTFLKGRMCGFENTESHR